MRFAKFLFAFLIVVQSLGLVNAQVSCAGQQLGEGCIKYPGQTYQCIDGDFFASTLYGAELLPPAQAQNTAQFIIVKGKITVGEDYTFAPGSDVVFLDNNSGFKVSNAKKLTLSSSWLHGCAKLWAGVEVLSSAKIVAQNCTFEDAKAAIVLRNQSVAEITGNTFKKNVCGILGLSPNPGIASISILLGSKKGISGNTFWGNHQLLEPIAPATIDPGVNSDAPTAATIYPYVGIWIERVNSLSIGSLSNQSAVPFNTFLNFGQNKEQGVRTQGIRSIRSNVSIQNSTFSNFGNYGPVDPSNAIEADAVFARNDGNVIVQTTFTGTNQTASIFPSNTFSNCYRDIRTIGTNLTVTQMSSVSPHQSIDARHSNPAQAPISYHISDNQIDGFKLRGIVIGLRKAAPVTISGNRLSDSDNPSDQESPRIAVELTASAQAGGSLVLKGNAAIRDNVIRSRSNFPQGAFWGIALFKVSYVIVENNQIFDDLPSTDLASFHAVRVGQSPCDGLRIYSNAVNGGTTGYLNGSGVFIRESVNCVLNCNETDNINIGILFLGMCDNADVSKNRFYHHHIGLGLGEPNFPVTTSIGLQSKKENRWFGTSSPVEAYATNLATALASRFEINSSDQNSDYWPFPRKIGTNDDNFVWFTQLTGQEPSNDYTCLTGKTFGEGALADSDIRLLNGTYVPPLNYPALTWEAKWQFAGRLNRNPALQTVDGATAQYFQDTYNDTYSRLNRAYQSYLDRWQPSTAIADLTGALETAVEQRFALDAALSETLGNNAALHTQMLAADIDIADKTAWLKTAVESWVAAVNQNVGALITEVNSVATTDEHETDMKGVLGVMLQSHFTAGELSAQQAALIAQIAGKCRYSGGYAVVLARSFLGPQESYSQDEACQSEERDSPVTPDIPDLVALCPNPATESFVLSVGVPFEQGQVRVFNSQGVLVRSLNLGGAATDMPVSDLPGGVYYLHVRLDNSVAARKTFVKI